MLKGLFRRWKLFGMIAFALLAISTTAISTMAWFTIERSQAIETGMVTGSGEVEVGDINGYKVEHKRKPNGFINYGDTTVTKMNYNTSDFETENSNQEGADTNFDIPTNGIGYYFIPAVEKTYRYANGWKMQTHAGNDSNLSYSENRTISAGSYRIREYGFSDESGQMETVSRKVSIADAYSTNDKLTVTVDNGDLLVTLASGYASANCKIWFDHALAKLAFDVSSLNAALPQGLAGGPAPHELYGNETIYFDVTSISSWFTNDGCKAFLHLWGTGGSTDVGMTQNGNVWSASVNVSSYQSVIFYRYTNTESDGSKWFNKTVDLTFETGTSAKRKYTITSTSGSMMYGEWGTEGTYSRTYQMTVGGNTYTLTKNNDGLDTSTYEEQYVKTGLTLSAGATFTSFTLNSQAITVSRDSGAMNLTNNLEVKIGGTINVYLKMLKNGFPNAHLYISEPNAYNVKLVVGSNETTLTKSTSDVPTYLSNGDECLAQYYVTGHTLATSNTLSFKINGATVSTHKDSGAPNLTSSLGVVKGGKVDLFLKVSKTNFPQCEVYITNVYTVTIGGVETQLDLKKTNMSSHEEWYTDTGITAAKDAVVSSVALNGTTITGWKVNTASGNNVNSSTKKIIKACSGEGAYYDISDKTLWITGNKKYTFKTYDPNNAGSTASTTEMDLCESGDFTGWYTLSNVSVTKSYKAEIIYSTFNGDGSENKQTLTIAYASSYTVSGHTYANNNLSSGCLFLKTGTSTLYFDTSSYKFYVTPVYSVKIGSTQLEATYVSGSTYQTAANFNISAQDEYSVKAYVNETELASYTASTNVIAGVANNLGGSAGSLHTKCFSDSNVYALVYTDSSTLWVSGYHDPIYTIKKNGVELEVTVGGNTVTATADVTANDTLTFIKNKTNMLPAANGDTNNVSKSGSTYTISSTAAGATITWDLSGSTVFVSGKALRYNFCDTTYLGEKLMGTPYAYVFDAHGHENAAWPGVAMEQDVDGSYYIEVTFEHEYTGVVFNNGSDRKTMDLTLSGNQNKYYWINSSASDTHDGRTRYTSGDWYAAPPQTGSEKTYYFHDKYIASHFGGSTPTMYAFSWKEGASSIAAGGAVFPGERMIEVIPGSLYSISVPNYFDRILFASTSKQTLNFNVSDVSTGSILLAYESTEHTYANNVDGAWGTEYSESRFGTALVHIFNGGIERTHAYTSDGNLEDEETLPMQMRTGDTSHNYYIFEEGIYAKAGEKFTISFSGTNLPGIAASGTLDGNNFVNDNGTINTSKYPFLNFANGGNITKDGQGQFTSNGTVTFAADGRYNFYVNSQGQISVAMVPIYGNGFYIMPYESTTEGFTKSIKMNTVSSTSGSYTGYKIEATSENKQFYFRSYLNAVDTIYKNFVIDPALNTQQTTYVTADSTTGVLTFQNGYSGYINIEIANNTIYVKPYKVGDFFKLDPLDIANRTVASQSDIKSQNTSLVLEVALHTDSDRALDLYLDIGNTFKDGSGKAYVGCSGWLEATDNALETPWETMRASHYTISTASSLKLGSTSGAGDYVAYILIDYKWDSTISSYYYLRSLAAATMTFDVRTQKKAVTP